MHKYPLLTALTITATLTLAACGDSDDDQPADTNSQFNPDAEPAVNDGQGGGDTTAIAGLWDGTTTQGDITDVVYWLLSEDGVLTRYDDQQDGVPSTTGENCYIVGDPISISPEEGDSYSFFNVATTAVRFQDTLTITFLDADINDVDNDGDTAEMPTFNWTILSTASVEDLNACTVEGTEQTDNTDAAQTDDSELSQPEDQTVSAENTDPADPLAGGNANVGDDGAGIPIDNNEAQRPTMTRAECTNAGGSVIGDIGDGAIHREEYRCESGVATDCTHYVP